jgi:hypothetical protein
MTETPNIPPGASEWPLADHVATDRQRQLDRAHYAQAITGPEASQHYRTDLWFRMEIDLHRQAMHVADQAMAEEGLSSEQRNRIIERMITGREPYRGVDVVLGDAAPLTLRHGPFGLTVGEPAIMGGRYSFRAVAVTCACGRTRRWEGSVAGGELLAWLHDHSAQEERQQETPKRRSAWRK